MKTQIRNTLFLVACALLWGMAFVAQSAGAGLGAYTFLACRSWLAVAVLWPTTLCFDAVRRRGAEYAVHPARGGVVISSQRERRTMGRVVLVPVAGLLFGRKSSLQLWVCMGISVAGLYLLCMAGGFGGVQTSDLVLLLCAVLFTFQIMAVDHYSPRLDGVRLSFLQFFTVAVESTLAAFLFEAPSAAEIAANAIPLLYCGILSSGLAYTLQILGQRDLDPSIASLAMCLESVFGALGGWAILGQSLTARELWGCALIFTAVVLAQLPVGDWLRRWLGGRARSRT